MRNVSVSGAALAIACAAAPATAQDCASLTGVAAHDTIISEAVSQPAADGLPAHCLVRGVIEPRIGTGGRQYGTGFELRMPEDWSGRFLMQGGGGWDGRVQNAIGVIDRTKPEDTALGRGIAVASTDAGHTGDSPVDGWWGPDMKARHDNGYYSAKLVTERTSDLMRRFYGEEPHHSYFMGCSNGGRQGMVAATRYPGDYDGVLAAAPAFDLTPSVIAWNWNTKALAELAAQQDRGGDLSQTFTDDELQMISDAAIAACDGADGAEDGLVMAPMQCSFDPAELQCGADGGNQCLSEAQVTALQKITEGPKDGAGNLIYHGWDLAGIAGPGGWRLWIVGPRPGPATTALGGMFQQDWMRLVGSTPPRPDFDAMTFDIDDREFLMEAAPIFAANSTDYAAYADNGGKLVIWHGTADPAFSTAHLVEWYDRMQQANDGTDFARLYLAPGVHHCAGGDGLGSFDALTPLIEWVENGTAPEAITASGTPPGADAPVSRPLCPYPAHAAPKADASDMADAESFECVIP